MTIECGAEPGGDTFGPDVEAVSPVPTDRLEGGCF